MRTIYVTICLVVLAVAGQAQKVQENKITFDYIRKPLRAIDKSITMYNPSFIQLDEERNAKVKEDFALNRDRYEKEFKERLELEEKQRQEARKSLGKSGVGKLFGAMMDVSTAVGGKPRQLTQMPLPYYPRVYEAKSIVDQYIQYPALTKGTTNSLEIVVKAEGFQHSLPKVFELTPSPNSNASPKYRSRFTYSYPVSVKLESNGKVIFDGVVPGTDQIYNQESTIYPHGEDAIFYYFQNRDQELPILQDRLMRSNLKLVNTFLVENFGSKKITRNAFYYSVTNKNDQYGDYAEAVAAMKEGLLSYAEPEFRAEAMVKLKKANDLFENALKESNLDDKDARINKNITIATYFNIMENSIWLNDFTGAKRYLIKLRAIPKLGWFMERQVDEYTKLIDDQKLLADASN